MSLDYKRSEKILEEAESNEMINSSDASVGNNVYFENNVTSNGVLLNLRAPHAHMSRLDNSGFEKQVTSA